MTWTSLPTLIVWISSLPRLLQTAAGQLTEFLASKSGHPIPPGPATASSFLAMARIFQSKRSQL